MAKYLDEEGREFRCGTPSAEEWNNQWRYSRTTPRHTVGEFESVFQECKRRLKLLGNVGVKKGNDFYFRGDDYGDRTQYLDIVNPDVLTEDLLYALQSWLREPAYRRWRIAVITAAGDECTPLVYSKVIRLGERYAEDLGEALKRIRARMKAGKRRRRKKAE